MTCGAPVAVSNNWLSKPQQVLLFLCSVKTNCCTWLSAPYAFALRVELRSLSQEILLRTLAFNRLRQFETIWTQLQSSSKATEHNNARHASDWLIPTESDQPTKLSWMAVEWGIFGFGIVWYDLQRFPSWRMAFWQSSQLLIDFGSIDKWCVSLAKAASFPSCLQLSSDVFSLSNLLLFCHFLGLVSGGWIPSDSKLRWSMEALEPWIPWKCGGPWRSCKFGCERVKVG